MKNADLNAMTVNKPKALALAKRELATFVYDAVQLGGINMTLHAVAAREEALERGCFRCGGVTIVGTDYMPPKAQVLPDLFNDMLQSIASLNDIYDRAITDDRLTS